MPLCWRHKIHEFRGYALLRTEFTKNRILTEKGQTAVVLWPVREENSLLPCSLDVHSLGRFINTIMNDRVIFSKLNVGCIKLKAGLLLYQILSITNMMKQRLQD